MVSPFVEVVSNVVSSLASKVASKVASNVASHVRSIWFQIKTSLIVGRLVLK